MDALGDLLRGIRANGAMVCRSIAAPPWALRFEITTPLTLVCGVTDDAWLIPDEGEPMLLRRGDVGLVREGVRFVLADDPASKVGVVIRDEDECIGEVEMDGKHTWRFSNRPSGDANEMVMLTAAYQVRGDLSDRLLSALPEVFVITNPDEDCPTMELLALELGRDRPGQEIAIDRLLDLILVLALRDWFDRPDSATPAWYVALGDPVVGPALRALHDDPARAWTVEGLARHVGVSRAGFARRFADLVGEPPLTYLTGWRMALAADLLRRTDASVASVARQVGYADSFAFSTAFKRVRGIRPSQHRTTRIAV
ncbi:AraC family transcriptional regulator [Kribbella sp. NBC_01245]|uniref:AraC family transcriptional regulator n=1 Tax=Kribbella sp. NBC_01245 TaxID=2903578 RepID=UPI002E2A8547|nr:AraC family transcriptional regulator [Kribbella sp. NBC_01245]